MRYVVVVKEIKEVYHQIEVELDDDVLPDDIMCEIDIGAFDDVEEVADYIDEIAPVCSVDECCEEVSKGFSCEHIFEYE